MKIYLVGGAVRDHLLGLGIKDRDWVIVGETPESLKQKGFQQVGNDFPVFIHPKTKEEYALARTERKQGQGYTGFVCDFSPEISLEEDLIRRDLTVNAIAQDKKGNLIDPFGGLQDLKQKQLRHVSKAFEDDPLRVLRVARFLARFYHLGFSIAPETLQLMEAMVAKGELAHLTPERVWLETKKALETQNPEKYFLTLQQINALPIIFPELTEYLAAQGQDNLLNILKDNTKVLPHIRLSPSDKHIVRFAKIFSHLPCHHIKALCQRLNLPRKILKLTENCACYSETIKNAYHLSGEEIIQLLSQLDFWRNSENFSLIRQVLGMDYQLVCEFLWRCYQVAKEVEVGKVIEDGFQKAGITQELNRRRAKAITSLMK